MALSQADEQRVTNQVQREADLGGVPNVTKADLLAAVQAVDAWVDSAQASFNAALPNPFKSNATATQKTLLLCYVLMRRMGKFHAEEDN